MQVDLPPLYYHDHFMEMLDAVDQLYGSMLSKPHKQFLIDFRNLSQNGQCLYIRMANRRGHVFTHDVLQYVELDIVTGIDELINDAFARTVAEQDLDAVLTTFKKDTLVELARHIGCEVVKPSWAKAKIHCHVLSITDFAALSNFIETNRYIVRQRRESLDYLLYLFFGKNYGDLKSFALRDLGVISVNETTSFSARFASAAEAETCFTYSVLRASLDSEADLANAVARLAALPPPTDYAANFHAGLVQAIGAKLEKAGNTDDAIALYRLANGAATNERLIRLLYASDATDEARSRLEAIIDDLASDQEYDFASDFYARKFQRQRVSAATALLRNSTSIAIDEIHRNNPEIGAANFFVRDGWDAHWTENGFWHALFGLLFWDELFGSKSMFHSAFDYLPKSLSDGSFHSVHASSIAKTMDALRSGKGARLVRKIARLQDGKPNALIAWEGLELEPIIACLENAPTDALALMMEAMAKDFYSYRDGFPDLMLVKPGEVRFVEIKAEGDAIRRNQLTRLRQLNRAGFDASITRVSYRFDPDQTYVVVDIETTGGRADTHRIIEIGAVKMRNHKIIDEWHSLIDPACRIPGFITSLTGIDNSMVKDAPRFADVADDFLEFMTGSVFVAHNVNFDYGFIAKEFERIDQKFRFPKFCTCAGMRRHHPGHASYSLGTLCQNLGIEMDRHHRALSDARASASLLVLINTKRSNDDTESVAA